MQNSNLIRHAMKVCSLDKQLKSGKRLSTMIISQHAISSSNFNNEGVATNAQDRVFNAFNTPPPLASTYFASLPVSRVMSPKLQQRNSFDEEEYDQSIYFASPHQAAIYFDQHRQQVE
jgi:hypothetical protein